MTPEEVAQVSSWDVHNVASLTVFSALFGRRVLVRFYPEEDSGRTITPGMAEVLREFLALVPADLAIVKQHLWADCLDYLSRTGYGLNINPGETRLTANQRQFGLHTAADAYAQSTLTELVIPEAQGAQHRYGGIQFEMEWAGHGCTVILRNGRLLTVYAGEEWHFSLFEELA